MSALERDLILEKLRRYAPNLKEAGVAHLRLFGSSARGDASTYSDVDLLAEFDQSRRFTLLTLSRLESELGELLGARVELSSPDWMKEPVRKQALQEAAFVF